MIKYTLHIFFIILFSKTSFAQIPTLEITDTKSVLDLVSLLERDGDQIENITFTIPKASSKLNPVGEYNDGLGLFGLTNGLIMTNGAATFAKGPNNNANKWQANTDEQQFENNPDPDVLEFLKVLDTQNETSIVINTDASGVYDYAIIEFDIKTRHSFISYDYIFASEEYPLPNQLSKADGFACYVSGPDIFGSKNIAKLTNDDVIGITNINNNKNTDVYISNGTGDTPFLNFYHQYDGYTQKLSAKTAVIPCETYHVKLFIIDEGWDQCDSGVLIEKTPLEDDETPTLEVSYDNENIPFLVEECNGAEVEIKLPTSIDLNDYELLVSGSATSPSDYNNSTIPTSLSLDSLEFRLEALQDNLPEGTETIILTLRNICLDDVVDEIEIPIQDHITFELPDQIKCIDDTVALYPDFNTLRDSLIWQSSPTLSCTTCLNPLDFSPTGEKYYYTYIDKISGCEVEDSLTVTTQKPKAFFLYSSNINYTSLDAFFENLSTNAVTYNWDFGNNATSIEKEPIHSYPITNNQEPETFKITLEVTDNIGCIDQYDTTIIISEPFFIPNVFTPNGDTKNEQFQIDGISLGIWHLDIFNRWGKLVYKQERYLNDWKSENVGPGVYYYRFSNPNEDRVFKGWVTVIK